MSETKVISKPQQHRSSPPHPCGTGRPDLPFTEVLALHGVKFEDALVSLLGRYAKKSR